MVVSRSYRVCTIYFFRIEVSGFINALFLIVIAFFIFLEALERLYDPPDIHTEKLMVVAVAGLLVNLFGMYAFHGSGHGHSHGGANANMQGVFLHVLADTLGSVFVIISTLLIEWFGWQWVDPLCSLILSLLILSSVAPLLRASAATLLQSVPADLDHQFEHVLDQILQIDGVLSYSRPHFWQLKSEMNVASIHVQINETANAQIVRQAIGHLLRNGGAAQYTVQVEKQSFLQRIVALCPSYRLPPTVSAGHCDGGQGHGHSHGMANGYVTAVPNIG